MFNANLIPIFLNTLCTCIGRWTWHLARNRAMVLRIEYTNFEQTRCHSRFQLVSLLRTDYTGVKISGRKKWGSEAARSGDVTRRIVCWYAPVSYRSQSQRPNERRSPFCGQNLFLFLCPFSPCFLSRSSTVLLNRAASKLPASWRGIRKNRTALAIARF